MACLFFHDSQPLTIIDLLLYYHYEAIQALF